MAHWNSSPHPISDIRDWQAAGRLELEPDFQRREVWSNSARIMLIDTILRDIPMPKIFVASSIREQRTYRIVIDGQQRIRTLLAFLRDEFALEAPFKGAESGLRFSTLSPETQDRILSYNIDFNEAVNPTEKEVREVYARVNKYTVALNKQELRRADYPGEFLKLSEFLSIDPYFETIRLFTAADRRRYADVEYVSELIAAMLGGVQDGKSSLDSFYQKYAEWDHDALENTTLEFGKVLQELTLIFGDSLPLSETRFRQKADFYSLFIALLAYVRADITIAGRDLTELQQDLKLLDQTIAPESDVRLCREYAIKCVSQANSGSSRRWRAEFMKAILDGTYQGILPHEGSAHVFFSILEDCAFSQAGDLCPSEPERCLVCANTLPNVEICSLGWRPEPPIFQLSNACWIGPTCLAQAAHLRVLERPEPNEENTHTR